MDGAIDESANRMRFAITVGTKYVNISSAGHSEFADPFVHKREPFVQVMEVYRLNDRVVFSTLAVLKGASRVLVLRDTLIGFAVLSGDDTFPCLADWARSQIISLWPHRYMEIKNTLEEKGMSWEGNRYTAKLGLVHVSKSVTSECANLLVM